jgi:hypothetical protein
MDIQASATNHNNVLPDMQHRLFDERRLRVPALGAGRPHARSLPRRLRPAGEAPAHPALAHAFVIARTLRAIACGPGNHSLCGNLGTGKAPTTVNTSLRDDEETAPCRSYQRYLLNLSTRSNNRPILISKILMSGPSCHDRPAWPCIGALCPCIRRHHHPGDINACEQ